MLVVNPSLPVHSLADLIKYAKDKGGPLPFAMVGPGTPHHLFAEMLKSMTGIEITYVPYRGSQPAITDVMAGHVPVMFCDLGPAGPQIAAGKVRAIGSFDDEPHRGVSGCAVAQRGRRAGFDAASWQMMVAPAKTPRPVVDKLHAELKAILALPEIKDAHRQERHGADAGSSGRRIAEVREGGDRALGQGGARRRASPDRSSGGSVTMPCRRPQVRPRRSRCRLWRRSRSRLARSRAAGAGLSDAAGHHRRAVHARRLDGNPGALRRRRSSRSGSARP